MEKGSSERKEGTLAFTCTADSNLQQRSWDLEEKREPGAQLGRDRWMPDSSPPTEEGGASLLGPAPTQGNFSRSPKHANSVSAEVDPEARQSKAEFSRLPGVPEGPLPALLPFSRAEPCGC